MQIWWLVDKRILNCTKMFFKVLLNKVDNVRCILVCWFWFYKWNIKHGNVSLEELKANSKYILLMYWYQHQQFIFYVNKYKKVKMNFQEINTLLLIFIKHIHKRKTTINAKLHETNNVKELMIRCQSPFMDNCST